MLDLKLNTFFHLNFFCSPRRDEDVKMRPVYFFEKSIYRLFPSKTGSDYRVLNTRISIEKNGIDILFNAQVIVKPL